MVQVFCSELYKVVPLLGLPPPFYFFEYKTVLCQCILQVRFSPQLLGIYVNIHLESYFTGQIRKLKNV